MPPKVKILLNFVWIMALRVAPRNEGTLDGQNKESPFHPLAFSLAAA
jgi:hypothetical protein